MITEHGIFTLNASTGRILNAEGLDWMNYANSRCEWDEIGNPISLPGTTFALVRSGWVARVHADPTSLVPNGELVLETDECVEMGMGYADGALTPAPPQPEPVVVLFPADLWRRTTDAEAEAIETAMAGQSARLRNLFRSAQTYQSDDPLWSVLNTAATDLFGAARTAELLAPS